MNEDDAKRQDKGACAPGCACGTSGSNGSRRMVAGIVILVVAGVLVIRAMVKDNGAASAAPAGFAALPDVAAPAPESREANPAPAAEALKELGALSDLNSVAGDTFGVFVFLPGRGETAAAAPMAPLRSAMRMIEPQLRGGKIGLFALKEGSRDYEQLAMQMAVPGVVALVKGGGMSAASGDITETKLVQALVAASGSGGCGAGRGGCGPVGCN